MPKAAPAKSKTPSASEPFAVISEIELLADFLYNKHPDVRDNSPKTEEQYKELALTKVHRNNEGLLIVPAWNLKVSLVAGCKKSKGKTDHVKAFVFPQDASWELTEPDGVFECWGRIPPRTGAMNKIYRPFIRKGRKLPVRFNIVSPLDSIMLKEAWSTTGFLVAIGAWRPEYGRFRVLSWDLQRLE